MKYVNILWSLVRFCFHIIVYLRSGSRFIIDYEINKWFEAHHLSERIGIRGLLYLLAAYPEFRSLFYFRTNAWWLNFFAKGQTNLEFYTESKNIGKGLIIWHGFSTVINAEKIGEDCQIWHNVTIGKKTTESKKNRPYIGSNVAISAGAIVIGDISIANDVKIGAGAVVVKDVIKQGCTVVSQPSKYI